MLSLFYEPTIYRWGLYFLAFYVVDQIIFSNYIDAERVGEIIGESFVQVLFGVVGLSFIYNISIGVWLWENQKKAVCKR